jgi:formylglycine-generating enzyme required for sulfatase activity
MGQTEVTQAQWRAVMGSLIECDPEHDFGTGENHPVYCLSWVDCQDFLAALNALSGEGTFRLPTEAEWEYACRAGTTKRFYFGNSLGCSDGAECEDCDADPIIRDKRFPPESTGSPSAFNPKIVTPIELKRSDFMWFCANSDDLSQPVRSLRQNAFGLFDMAGNVFEWVQDEYHADYTGAPTDGSAWIGGGSGQRVLRGGAFVYSAQFCRSASRGGADPLLRSVSTGFRIVWTP